MFLSQVLTVHRDRCRCSNMEWSVVWEIVLNANYQGDHLSGKPGNVRELYRCQGYVRNFTKSHGYVRELSGKKSCHGKLLLWMPLVFYDVIIMKSLSLNMNLTVWSLTLTPVVQAWYEYQLKWSGVLRIVMELSGNFIVSGEWSPWIIHQL